MYRPSLRQLAYAVALADHRHFGRAAEAEHVSQPGLSSQIRELESRLGVALFERDSRSVRPTPAGEEVVARAREVLRRSDELVLAAALHGRAPHGRLRLAAIPTVAPYLLPALVSLMRGQWPGIDPVLRERQTAPMIAAIEEGSIDLGLLALPWETGGLRLAAIEDEPFLLALPEGHELATSTPAPLSALADLPMLLLEEGHCLRDHALAVCARAGSIQEADIHSASLTTLARLAARGEGATLLPARAAAVEAGPGAGLVTRPFEPPAPGRTVALAWRSTDPRASHYETLAADFRRSLRAGSSDSELP